MKLITFKIDGVESYGTVSEEGVRDAGVHLRDQFSDLTTILAGEALDA